ncbi:acyltransferase [Dysgonomonas sp.]
MMLFLQFILFIFPWKIRKFFLKKCFNFQLSETARIGFSIIMAKRVQLGEHTRIGHLNYCKKIDLLEIGDYSNIGNKNLITGFSVHDADVIHYKHIKNRQCVLKIGNHTGITSRHYFDCNAGVFIGDFTEIAGFETAFLTHSVNIAESIQDAAPILIGNYNFIGTRCTILKGTETADKVVVGACSLINKPLEEGETLYAGVPCKKIKKLTNSKYFARLKGAI